MLLLSARLVHGACSTLSHGVMQPSHGLSPWDAGCADVNWGLLNTLNGGYSTVWNSREAVGDFLSAPPDALDDEFNANAALSGSWSTVNGGSTTFTEENSADLKVTTNTGDATVNLRGVFQATPGAVPWEVTTRITGPISNNNTQYCMLAIRNSNASNKHLEIFGPAFVNASGFNIIGNKWDDVAAFNSNIYNPANYTVVPTTIQYVRVKVDSTNVTWSISQDGLAWFQVFQEAKSTYMEAVAGTINQVGLIAEDTSASVATTCYFYFFHRTG